MPHQAVGLNPGSDRSRSTPDHGQVDLGGRIGGRQSQQRLNTSGPVVQDLRLGHVDMLACGHGHDCRMVTDLLTAAGIVKRHMTGHGS